MQRDFWGKQKKKRVSQLEKWLQKHDKDTLADRLARLNTVKNAMASPSGYVLSSPDSVFLFNDARDCFINGQFAACIIVCQSLLEHRFKGLYRMAGDDNIINISFKNLINKIIDDKILPDFLASKLNNLRIKRNPLVHMSDDPLGYYFRKSGEKKKNPDEILEQDAKETFLLTFEIFNGIPFA